MIADSHADYEDGLDAAMRGDYETAYREFQLAAENGLSLAQYNLAILYFMGQGVEQNDEQAFFWTREAAQQGHLGAQYNLGSLYLDGRGVAQDANTGRDWMERAARAGHGPAAISLARMLQERRPFGRDLVTAHAWAATANFHESPEAAAEMTAIEGKLSEQQLAEARRLFARWQVGL